MIQAREALDIVLGNVKPLGEITLSLEHALGSAIAERIVAAQNIPPFPNSAMDGYAVRSSDLGSIPAALRIAGEIPAGALPAGALRAGETMRIMTGARIPDGCDCVVQQEWTRESGNGTVEILRTADPGHNIRSAGTDIAEGQVVLRAGTVLRPQHLGVLASLGKTFVRVYRPPSVALLTTGAELIPAGGNLVDGKIRDSNAVVLSGLLHEMGCSVMGLGIAADDRAALAEKMRRGLEADALITSGGVSVGKFDLVPEVAKELGVEIKFRKVNIKPGMPLLFGMRGETAVFGLPGNPVSSMVTFLQFVRPALWKMKGRQPVEPLRLRAHLGEPITKHDGKRHFIRGMLQTIDGRPSVRPTGSQVSHILSSLVKADCLIIVPEEITELPSGAEVEIELL